MLVRRSKTKQLVSAMTAVLTGTAVAVVGLSGPAAAAPPERETFEVAFQDVAPDFCGSPGLTVHVDGTATVRVHEMTRGAEQLPHHMEHARSEIVFTNPSTGEHVRRVERVTLKDLEVTDNGDGTLTLLVLGTGFDTTYDSDGKAIARNPGQTRFELLIDHAGTPSDASDDEFLAFLGIVKESTGRNDDFCTAAVAAIG